MWVADCDKCGFYLEIWDKIDEQTADEHDKRCGEKYKIPEPTEDSITLTTYKPKKIKQGPIERRCVEPLCGCSEDWDEETYNKHHIEKIEGSGIRFNYEADDAFDYVNWQNKPRCKVVSGYYKTGLMNGEINVMLCGKHVPEYDTQTHMKECK